MRHNLINARQKKGIIQSKMASVLGISHRHYARLEAGTSNGSVEIWQELKRITGCSIDYLLEQEVDKEEKPDGNRARKGT